MKKNDEIIIDITATSAEGFGIGRHENLAIFVPSATEGDKAKVHIVKVKKNYAYAKLIELLEPSAFRINSDCQVFDRCGGCAYRHIIYQKECEIKSRKVADCMKRIGKIDLPPKPIIAAEDIYGYRNKAQLPFSKTGKTGFYSLHSHRIIETNNCLLSPPIFNTAATIVSEWANDNSISFYDESTQKGLLRHLYIRQAKATEELMVVLVINGKSLPNADSLIEKLKKTLGNNLKSFQININTKETNVILGETCRTLFGKSYITDILCGVKIRISPLSFYQVNHDMAELLYEKAAEYAKPAEKDILDLYCGTGTIGLSMAAKAKSITGVEIIPDAISDAKINAAENGIKNAEFFCADAAAAAKELTKRGLKPDVVILDPPRKGCAEDLLHTVANSFSPKRLVYISCDPATLARDSAILNELGYKLQEYTPVDLFPRTHHIETVALFIR